MSHSSINVPSLHLEMHLTEELCQKYEEVVNYPIYRCALFFSLIISSASMVSLIYIMCFIFRRLTYHENFKTLLFAFYAVNLLFDCVNTVGRAHHLIIAYLHSSPCEVIVSPKLHYCVFCITVFHIMSKIFVGAMMSIQLVNTSFWPEAKNKDQKMAVYSLVFVLSVSFLLALITMTFYFEAEPSINYFSSPRAMDSIVIKFQIFHLLYSVAGLLIAVLISRYNVWKEKKVRYHLNPRYQVSCNQQAAHLLSTICALSFCINVIYSAGQLVTRTFKTELFGDSLPKYRTARQFTFITPLFGLCLAWITIYSIRYKKKSTAHRIRLLTAPQTGTSASEIYRQLLESQWGRARR